MAHIIIGAGPAGVIAAEGLREAAPEAAITLIGDEPGPPYSRMAIPYLLTGDIDESGTFLRKEAEHYLERDIELVHDRVDSIDTGAREVRLAGGDSLPYESLLIATGSHPVPPPIPGIDLPGVHACWTLEDARNVARLATEGSRVVLMGAGFIGCIILESLALRGVDLTVVEMGEHVVPRMLNDTPARLIEKWCGSKGVRILTSTRAMAIEQAGQGGSLTVSLDNGETLAADLVIAATGVKPNISFLAGSGIETDQGVLVDRNLRSNIADVYAAGDVAQGLDFSTGEYSVHAIQPTAADHGRIAALNMAGREAGFQGSVVMNVLATLGLVSSSFGLWAGVDGGDAAELVEAGRYRYLRLQFEDDVLVGSTSLGLTEHVGVLRGLIQGRVRLGRWKKRLVADPTRIMEAYLGATRALGANLRML